MAPPTICVTEKYCHLSFVCNAAAWRRTIRRDESRKRVKRKEKWWPDCPFNILEIASMRHCRFTQTKSELVFLLHNTLIKQYLFLRNAILLETTIRAEFAALGKLLSKGLEHAALPTKCDKKECCLHNCGCVFFHLSMRLKLGCNARLHTATAASK